jgi:WhiB family redox-sensing transcriptional regulator
MPAAFDFPYLVDERAAWVSEAACRGYRTDVFFPKSMTDDGAAEAVALCNRCPVQRECARYAIVNNIEFGIWGGLSPRARREIASSASRRDRSRELATFETYNYYKKQGRTDPVKATARALFISTATVYHHIRIIKFKQIFDDGGEM